MARLIGRYVEGTLGDVTFYKMSGQWYARKKTSIDAKRMKSDPAFAPQRASAALLAQASVLASAAYRQIPPAKRRVKLYRAMVKLARKRLKTGKTSGEVTMILQRKVKRLLR